MKQNNIYIEDAKNGLAWEEHAKNNSYEYQSSLKD